MSFSSSFRFSFFSAVGNLPQYANVRSCNCCPYGYHIDLDFVRYCESLANAKPSEEELQRRSRRRSRKSMEFMLGLDSIFDQWDAIDKPQTLTEVSWRVGFFLLIFFFQYFFSLVLNIVYGVMVSESVG